MKREYFCCGYDLFHWVDLYKTDSETGRIDNIPYQGCPNNECISQTEQDVAVFAVDTYGYPYFSESYADFINSI